MRSHRLLTAGVVVITLAGSAAAAGAAPRGSGSHIVPQDTVTTSGAHDALKLGFTIDGLTDQSDCSDFDGRGRTPGDGLKVTLGKAPVFKDCTDALAGTDDVSTTGTWTLTSDKAGTVTVHVPTKGIRLQSPAFDNCTLLIGPGTIPGTLPVEFTGCSSAATATITPRTVWTPDFRVTG